MTDFLAEARVIAQRALNEPLTGGGGYVPPAPRTLSEIETAISDADILLQVILRQVADFTAAGIRNTTIARLIKRDLRAAESQLSAAIIALDAIGASLFGHNGGPPLND